MFPEHVAAFAAFKTTVLSLHQLCTEMLRHDSLLRTELLLYGDLEENCMKGCKMIRQHIL